MALAPSPSSTGIKYIIKTNIYVISTVSIAQLQQHPASSSTPAFPLTVTGRLDIL
jgi:hypothetical protein